MYLTTKLGEIKKMEEVKRNYWYIGINEEFMNRFLGIETTKVRARNAKGHFVKDDPKTKNNEAYKTVRKPTKKLKKAK